MIVFKIKEYSEKFVKPFITIISLETESRELMNEEQIKYQVNEYVEELKKIEKEATKKLRKLKQSK